MKLRAGADFAKCDLAATSVFAGNLGILGSFPPNERRDLI